MERPSVVPLHSFRPLSMAANTLSVSDAFANGQKYSLVYAEKRHLPALQSPLFGNQGQWKSLQGRPPSTGPAPSTKTACSPARPSLRPRFLQQHLHNLQHLRFQHDAQPELHNFLPNGNWKQPSSKLLLLPKPRLSPLPTFRLKISPQLLIL
jgi:hypothetical protein